MAMHLDDETLEELKDRGYKPNDMLVDGWDSTGYERVVRGKNRRPKIIGDRIETVHEAWKSPDDFRLVQNGWRL